MTRRYRNWIAVILITLVCVTLTTAISGQSPAPKPPSLYEQFVDPPKIYSPMPFWFWNGRLDPAEVQAEVRRMMDQHVYGAFLHARDGLLTPYLSEDWFAAFGAGLEEAKRVGFYFNFVDEYDWPSGEVRNIWMSGNHQSEVLARNPKFHMRSLAYKEQIVHGPQPVSLPKVSDLQSVVAVRWLGGGRVDPKSLRSLALPADGAPVEWTAPDGDWIVMEFYLEESMGLDGGVVDLMNPDAMKLYFDLSYGEYYRRFAPYFGSTIRFSFSDHEGDFGFRIGWTPVLYDSFAARNGYDLRSVLPLLVYDGGGESRDVRKDYLATVTSLYQNSYWNGITAAANKLGIARSGHAWEETLQTGAIFEGSLFALERGLNPVGVDSLGDFGRQPLNFKVAQSVADFERRRFACENQGVQGTDSYLDMQGLRKPTNSIGAWGVNLFIPHAFDYDVKRANYAPDWLHQPYWPYFHNYADYVRRISFMNSEDSHHATGVLLYYPMLSVWAESNPKFNHDTDYQRLAEPQYWRNRTVLINDYYTRMILRLAERQWDYNIADDFYFEQARVEGNELVIGPQRFRTIVLPPITTISPATLVKILEFYRAGGTVIGIRMLPSAVEETEKNAAVIQSGVDELFGTNAARTAESFTANHNASGGTAYYVSESVESLVDLLDAHATKDVRVISGSPDHFFAQHREKSGLSYYWFVNDSDRPRSVVVELSAAGVPEKWDALTGQRSAIPHATRSAVTPGATAATTEVRLDFAPWDAYYVVFRAPDSAVPAPPSLLVDSSTSDVQVISQSAGSIVVRASAPGSAKNISVEMSAAGKTYSGASAVEPLAPIAIADPWNFRVEPDRVSVPYAKVFDAPSQHSKNLEYMQPKFDDSGWSSAWLSEAQNTIRTWNVIGPFPNPQDAGFATVYPPEEKFDPDAHYAGADNQLVQWQRYYGDEPYLSKNVIVMETSGGHNDDDSPVVDFTRAFSLADKPWVSAYALTYLYSPVDQPAVLVVAADNWAKIWLDRKLVFAQLRHPFWYETNDNWADRIPVNLHKGWNEVLVKAGVGRGAATGQFGFTFRVADDHGKTVANVVSSLSPGSTPSQRPPSDARRYYRVEIPPGTVAVIPPDLPGGFSILVNGQKLDAANGQPMAYEKLLRPERNILVLESSVNDRLSSPLEFVTGVTPFALESLTKTGLANFSGTAIYDTSFTVPPALAGKRLFLDLGRVSSVAEVTVNGRAAGTLIWDPYRLEITDFVHEGQNRVVVRVTNTEANARAVGSTHNILANIDLSGMAGPVTLVPYVTETLTLHPK